MFNAVWFFTFVAVIGTFVTAAIKLKNVKDLAIGCLLFFGGIILIAVVGH